MRPVEEPCGGAIRCRPTLGAPARATDPRGMYIRYDVHVDHPAHSVRREMLEPPEQWLPPSVAEPIAERHYLVRIGFSAPAIRISKEVELTVGAPQVVGQWLEVPITWRATGPGELFPVLDGKLTVQPLGPHSSTLWFGGTYQPPLGALGREIDGVVMHNVAEATIKDFVESAAARLSELAANRPA